MQWRRVPYMTFAFADPCFVSLKLFCPDLATMDLRFQEDVEIQSIEP